MVLTLSHRDFSGNIQVQSSSTEQQPRLCRWGEGVAARTDGDREKVNGHVAAWGYGACACGFARAEVNAPEAADDALSVGTEEDVGTSNRVHKHALSHLKNPFVRGACKM